MGNLWPNMVLTFITTDPNQLTKTEPIMLLQVTQGILFKEKLINKPNKINGLQLQGTKQRKVGGSGNLIRGGAGVLNLSKVTGSLYRPAPEVIEHWCFHCLSAQQARTAAAAPEWKLGLNLLSVLPGFDSEPERLKDGEGTGQSQKTESMHVERHLDTKAGIWDHCDVHTHTHTHTDSSNVTCCTTRTFTPDEI